MEHQPDFELRYMDGPNNISSLQSNAERMLSSLFYVELVSAPRFYSSPEAVCVRLLCRLPPSSLMTGIIKGLHLRNSSIHYHGAEAEWTVEPLVTPAILARCRNGESFSRVLEVQVSGMDTELDVRLHDTLMGNQSVSHCPYRVGRLIRDQGLDCAFGRRDHGFSCPSETTGSDLTAAIAKLSEELDRFSMSGRRDTYEDLLDYYSIVSI